MDITVPDVGIDVPSVSQVAWVVEDLGAAMERYDSVLGFGPWEVHRIEPPEHTEMFYRGRETECGFEIGYTNLGDLEIEFIEPIAGESVHRDFLQTHGEGIHHLACFEFDDVPAVVEAFENVGVPVVQEGVWHDTHYLYFVTRKLLDGLYFETLVDGDVEPEPAYTYPDSEEAVR